jgi:hypothetical protein
MTVGQFGRQNDLDRQLLKKVFGLKREEDLRRPVGAFSLTKDQIAEAVARERALSEDTSQRIGCSFP